MIVGWMLALGLLGASASQAQGPTLLSPGESAPDFAIKSLQGNDLSLSQLLKKKQAVLLTFFVVNSPNCAGQLAELQKCYDQFRPKDLEIVAVNVEPKDDPAQIQTVWYKQKLSYYVAKAEPGLNNLVRSYKVQVAPTSYVVGKDGKVLAAWFGYLEPDKGAAYLRDQLARAGFK
jgi:peroxiredoxin